MAFAAMLLVGWCTRPLDAQVATATAAAPATAPAAAPADSPQSSPAPTSTEIDASKLPINLARLQAKLRTAAAVEDSGGSKLRFTVDVFGQAPKIQFFLPDALPRYGGPTLGGTVGGPTHQEMMNFVTPREFNSPVMDFNSLMKWIQSRTKKKD